MWNGGEEVANYNSSDDEERSGPEGREEGHTDIDTADPWPMDSASGPVADSPVNPWTGGNSQLEVTSTSDDSWADFEANFGAATISDFVNTTEDLAAATPTSAVPVTTAVDSQNEVLKGASEENRLDPPGAPTEPVSKNDDNANPSSSIGNPAAGEASQEQLLENFRFLSAQGLITEPSSLSDSGDSKVLHVERVLPSSENKSSEETISTEVTERESSNILATEPDVPKVQQSDSKDQAETTSEVIKTSPASPPSDPV